MTSTAVTMPPPGSIVPSRVGRALLIACWLSVVYGMAAVVPHVPSVRGIAAWSATLVFLLTFSLAVERRSTAPLLALSALAGVVMQLSAPDNGAFVAVVASIAVAGVRLEPGASRRVAVLGALGFLAAGAFGEHPVPAGQTASMVPGLLFTYLGATAMRRLRIEQERAQQLLQEAIAGRDARVRAAALDERAHLAREMHDVLAHTLSALSLQLEGTRLLAEQRACDGAVVTAVGRAGELAREGLGEARRAVSSLRGEGLPGPDLLPQLAQEFERDTGVPCRLLIEGRPRDLPPELRLTLYRVAQEALTNVRKHAAATSVQLTLRFLPGAVELEVADTGEPRGEALPGGGYGLSGMRERAERLRGRLEAGATDTGFRVRLWIPTAPDNLPAAPAGG